MGEFARNSSSGYENWHPEVQNATAAAAMLSKYDKKRKDLQNALRKAERIDPFVGPQSIKPENKVITRISKPITESVIFAATEVKPAEKEIEFHSSVEEYIDYFDRNWSEEGLPPDWYELNTLGGKEAGFSMRLQMELLKDMRPESVKLWMDQTETDLLGFCLEYLAGGVVYAYQYQAKNGQLIDMKYQKDMVAITSDKERGGIPKKKLKEVSEFFLSDQTPDGSIVVIPSPHGPTDLATDKGKPIIYDDSYFFVLYKKGDTVSGVTVKTDFSYEESSKVIEKITGQHISPTAPLEEFCKAVAFLTPRTTDLKSIEDVVGVLKSVRAEDPKRAGYVFEDIPWDNVDRDVAEMEKLYSFGDDTKFIIDSLKTYVLSGKHTYTELKKAVAATMYRLSKLFLFDKKKQKDSGKVESLYTFSEQDKNVARSNVKFGKVLEVMANIPGCQGGEKNRSRFMAVLGGARATAIFGKDKHGDLAFSCPHCGHINVREPGGPEKFIKKCGETSKGKKTGAGCGKPVNC